MTSRGAALRPALLPTRLYCDSLWMQRPAAARGVERTTIFCRWSTWGCI